MSAVTVLAALVVGLIASGIGGALGGLATGAKALGTELAATMGMFFGPVGGFTGVALALLLLALIG